MAARNNFQPIGIRPDLFINKIEERREITPKISAFSMKMFKGFAELNSPAPVKKREETKL